MSLLYTKAYSCMWLPNQTNIITLQEMLDLYTGGFTRFGSGNGT